MFRKQNSESGNWLAWRVEGREELRVIQSFPPRVTKNMVRILAGEGIVCVGKELWCVCEGQVGLGEACI